MTQSRSFVLTLGFLTGVAALTVDLSLPAIPALVEALATDLGRGQQIVGIFMAGMALGQIPAGLLSDRLGRMPVIYAGMGLFAISATVGALAQSIELLLAARFVQGFGAASAIVISRAVVRDIASGKEAAKLMSLMTMIFTAAPVIAPTIGAVLIAAFGWRAPFTAIAICGFLLLLAVRANLYETHTPNPQGHPLRQLQSSIAEFFRHRQSIFGLVLIVAAPAGFMSIITVSAALITQSYGFSLRAYGLIFALAGLSILLGSTLNRSLVARFEPLQMIRVAVFLAAAVGMQLGIMLWFDAAPLWWLWSVVCLFMFTVGILLPNATVIALDPLPSIAGVASSIIGTLMNVSGAGGALLGAVIYDGSVRSSLLLLTGVSLTIVLVYVARPLICPRCEVLQAEPLGRD